jgi:molybdate transport system substrate-binding protein
MSLLLHWCLWAAILPLGGGAQEPITVSAALSLTNVMEDIGDAWKASGGTPVRFNFGPSNSLARQIINGAPVDLFLSADEAQMDHVERAGGIIPGSRGPVVRNQLAVVTLPARVAFVKEHFHRAPIEIRRLALGDPVAVPAGVYARRYLEQRGLWSAYAPRVVPTANVRAAVAAVENGGADAAMVYASDVRVARSAVLALLIPAVDGPAIVYPGAVVRSSRHRFEAERFLAFIRSEGPQGIFARHGFLPLSPR